MIKRLDPSNINLTIIERLSRKRYHLCVDASSYDAAQRGQLWEIEKELFTVICGEDNAELWAAIAQNPNNT